MLPLLLLSLKYIIILWAHTSCTASQSMISYIKKLNLKKLRHKQEAKFLSVSVIAMPIYNCRIMFCL